MAQLLLTLTFTIFLLNQRSTLGFTNPVMQKFCTHDAFIASDPYEGKEFLFPWKTSERKGDWNYNRGYCAQNCAEMVTLRNQNEHIFFYNFMVHNGMVHPGVWLGAQVNQKQLTRWYNSEEVIEYNPAAPGEFDQTGLTCLDMGWDNGQSWWRNYHCAGALSDLHFVACQRSASATGYIGNCNCHANCIAGTASGNGSHLCICASKEEPTPITEDNKIPDVKAVDCDKPTDLFVVLDSSGSIRPENYEIAKIFVDRLAKAFIVTKGSRFGFITYSDMATVVVDIRNTFTLAEISSKILNATYDAAGTNTDLGIITAINNYEPATRSVPVNIVLLTDGISANRLSTADAAGRAMLLGFRTYAIGITSSVNQEELITIAGGNSNRIFNTENFLALIDILAPVSRKVCSD